MLVAFSGIWKCLRDEEVVADAFCKLEQPVLVVQLTLHFVGCKSAGLAQLSQVGFPLHHGATCTVFPAGIFPQAAKLRPL